ncbi:MAG: ATP-binding cassette domain-containing protein [Desulfurivibrio sp.]|nr:ATP-binding cassette domain-containing protein [Desulfurivibrio sp.]
MTLHVQAQLNYGQDFELKVDAGLPLDGVTVLFGRSGCGKTTLLRIISGLERIRGATVRFGDQLWQQGKQFVPLHKRRIGLVFQEHSLLPHLSVRENLLYGYRRTPLALRRLHPPKVTALLDIDDLLERRIDQLSGGQRQRVALGRALLISPQLMLLDEPLSALDTQTKQEIIPFFSRMAAESGVPIIMVTHAPDEVERLADRVVFLNDGKIERSESLREALSRPDSPLLAAGSLPASKYSLPPALGRDRCTAMKKHGGKQGKRMARQPGEPALRWRGRLWLEGEEGTFLGYGRVVLLERIREHGSISQAAKSMEMSYKHAWDLLASMQRQAGVPLVETCRGGKAGGGSRLTPAGVKAIALFRSCHDKFREFLATLEESQTAFNSNSDSES